MGRGKRSRTKIIKAKFYYTEENCSKELESIEALQEHLCGGVHEYDNVKPTQLSKVADKWVKMHQVDRVVKRHSPKVKEFLNKLFDEGECTKNKCTPEKAHQLMRKELDVDDLLSVKSIKSYFSRRNSTKKTKEQDDGTFDEEEDENQPEQTDTDDSRMEDTREKVVQGILHDLKVILQH